MKTEILFSLTLTEELHNPYIKLNGYNNLFIIPYVQGRLNFAKLVAETMDQNKIDLILTDLPKFLNYWALIKIPLRALPFLSSLYMRHKNGSFHYFTFAPNDAPFTAIILANMYEISYECLDDPNLLFYPKHYLFKPKFHLKDDYFIFCEGLKKYYTEIWSQLENEWNRSPKYQQECSDYRATQIVRNLHQNLDSKKNTLFVCEYRLWWLVKKLLLKKSSPKPVSKAESWEDIHAAFVLEDPKSLWSHNQVDDFPLITLQFYNQLMEKNANNFDKLKFLDNFLLEFFTSEQKKVSGCCSIRKLEIFSKFLIHLVSSSKRVTPFLAQHIFKATKAVFTKKVAKTLVKHLLEYPIPTEFEHRESPTYYKISPNEIFDCAESFEIPEIFDCECYFENTSTYNLGENKNIRQELLKQTYPNLTKKEYLELSQQEPSGSWVISHDKLLHYFTDIKIKEFLRKRFSEYKTVKSRGSLKDKIHWKKTLNAMFRAEDCIFVKKNIIKDLKQLDELTPISVVFSEDHQDSTFRYLIELNITERLRSLDEELIESIDYPQPDSIVSGFRLISKMEYLLDDHIRREELIAMGFLYVSHFLNLERYVAISKRPNKYLCRTDPIEDPELNQFAPIEQIIAWTIKYANNVVVILAYSGWKPSLALEKFAAVRKVILLINPLNILAEEHIEKLKCPYFTSTALKKHPNCDDILRRFMK